MSRSQQRFLLGAAVLAIGSFLVVALLFVPVPVENQQLAYTLTGLLLGWGGAVVQFYFGTSEGSVAKSEQIDRMMKEPEQ